MGVEIIVGKPARLLSGAGEGEQGVKVYHNHALVRQGGARVGGNMYCSKRKDPSGW